MPSVKSNTGEIDSASIPRTAATSVSPLRVPVQRKMNAITSNPSPTTTTSKSGASSSKRTAKDKESTTFSGHSGGQDFTDVAATIRRVSLSEEYRNLRASMDFVGTETRSCRDETFLQAVPLQAKIKAIAAKHGLEEPPLEVTAMISHAVEERLKTVLEKLAVTAEHRLEAIKMDERCKVTLNAKGQLRFLEELANLEKKRNDEQEREMLIKVAKSSSRSRDPETLRLRAKAKEMQRVEKEEMRRNETNFTALQAIGSRKKAKLDVQPGSQSTVSQSSNSGVRASDSMYVPHQISLLPRLKRVNIRDMLLVLEREKDPLSRKFLYQFYLK